MPPPDSPETGPVTLEDVARAAGVHASTVSRVLNRPGRINPDTARRVQEAADRLGYEPNRVARLLAGGRTGSIALVVPDLGNPFFAALAQAVQRRAMEAGSIASIVDGDGRPAEEVRLIGQLRPNVDGFVLAAPTVPSGALRRALGSRPAVLVNRQVEGIPAVVADQRRAVTLAMEHLRALGHERIGYVRGPAAKWTSGVRDRAATREGATLLGPAEPSVDGGAAMGAEVRAARVTAAVAHNDLVALGLMHAVVGAGDSVPGDLSLVGCDDIDAAALARPALTSVAMPLEGLGVVATERLLDRLAGPAPCRQTGAEDTTVLPVDLVVRESTGPPAR